MTRLNRLYFFVLLAPWMIPVFAFTQALPPAPKPNSVLLKAQYHSGENAHYTFSESVNVTKKVNPDIASDVGSEIVPRQYKVDGEIVASFAPGEPGQPLRATVQFHGLAVKNWVSAAPVSDFEARVKQLEATSLTLTTAADGGFELSGGLTPQAPDPYYVDVKAVENLAY